MIIMLRSTNIFVIVIISFFCFSCKKTTYNNQTTGALNVINAAADLPSVNVYFSDSLGPSYEYQRPISPGTSYEWGVGTGDIAVTINSSADTANALYKGHIQVRAGGIYSLYVLGGQSKDNTLLLEDTIPVQKDSAIGVRFINLSSDSKPFTVNLAENDPTQFEFSNLGYKQVSAFKTYPKNDAMGYNFEVRDQASGDLVTSLSLYYTYYKSYTLMIYGSIDPSSPTPVAIGQINNF